MRPGCKSWPGRVTICIDSYNDCAPLKYEWGAISVASKRWDRQEKRHATYVTGLPGSRHGERRAKVGDRAARPSGGEAQLEPDGKSADGAQYGRGVRNPRRDDRRDDPHTKLSRR